MYQNILFAFILLFSLLELTACMPKINPGVKVSPIQPPISWHEKSSSTTSKKDPIIKWWQRFNDPQLDNYISDVFQSNLNLQTLTARIQEERAIRMGIQSGIYPQINTTARYAKYQFSVTNIDLAKQYPQLTNKPSISLAEAGFDASWEIDIWGKQRWNIIAATENIEVANEYRRTVLISLIAELAKNYMELRGNQSQLQILQQNIANQAEYLKLIQSTYKIGLAAHIDTIKEQELLTTMQSQLPNLQAAIKASAYNISVLTGRNPEALLTELLPPKALPKDIKIVYVGLPADLILRRPDIRQTQRELGVAIALVGSAKANLYPTININGGVELAKLRLSDLFNLSGNLWSIVPAINWKIFDRRALTSTLEANRAKVKAADANLRQTVLNAIQDVENSISYLDASRKTANEIAKTTASSQQIYTMMKNGYHIGLKNKFDILEAKKTYLNNQTQLVATKVRINLQTINLYKALGGGWQ